MKLLSGIRILTIEQFGAAPYGSQCLADLGAEVIKIEQPDSGDAARSVGPFHLGENDSLYFQGWNTNKQSVVLDLKSTEGQAALHRLVGTADAIMNNLRGDQAVRLGLDYKTLSQINPKIVCGHISAYGRDNERASRPGYDFLMQAEAGLMSLTGDPASDPTRFGPSVIDFMTGMTLSVGLLAAVIRARQSGEGCDVDTALFDVALHQLNYIATWYLNRGYIAQRLPRSSHFSAAPVQTFKASDGWIFIMCMTDKFWSRLAEGIGQEALLSDARFSTMEARSRNRAELTAVLDLVFESDTVHSWVERLGDLLPIGPVYDIESALESSFVQEVGMIQNVPHPTMPGMRLLANPLRINGQRLEQTACQPLGANNKHYLAAAFADVAADFHP